VRTELFHADGGTDGQTDMMKLIVTFRNFANTPKYEILGVFFYVGLCMWTEVVEMIVMIAVIFLSVTEQLLAATSFIFCMTVMKF